MKERRRRRRNVREGPRDTSLDVEQVEVTFLPENISSSGREQLHMFLKPSPMLLGENRKEAESE